MQKSTLIIYPAGFLAKYFAREAESRGKSFRLMEYTPGNQLPAIEEATDNVVFISSTDVYGATEGSGLTEGAVIDPVTPLGIASHEVESSLAKACEHNGAMLTILRAPLVVGTGMSGRLESMVKSIYRANYYHVADETAKVSVIHATDLARAAFDLAGAPGVYNATDGCETSLHDLAEAFAYRLEQKRIFTILPKRAKRWASIGKVLPFMPFNPKSLAARYTTLTFSGDKMVAALTWKPTPVTEYLRTHVYDQNSL